MPGHEDDSAYAAIIEHNDESRWAFGTGFVDPLAGVDTSVPEGVDPLALAQFCLMLGDDALIMSQRLQQWIYRAPELEEETALANIALDLLGQARMLLSRVGRADGSGRDEDALAYFREAGEFGNVTLVEVPDGDFASCIARLLYFSTWRLAQLAALRDVADPVLAAIAAKGVTELTYHREYAAGWVVRLGDGTDESARRMTLGLAQFAPYLPELFDRPAADQTFGCDVRAEVENVLGQVWAQARLALPPAGPDAGFRGRLGRHTEHLAPLLAELQTVARADPDATW
jgi:ring-1,2-phenylacetyl-CoA epoxidase subunit PaaC